MNQNAFRLKSNSCYLFRYQTTDRVPVLEILELPHVAADVLHSLVMIGMTEMMRQKALVDFVDVLLQGHVVLDDSPQTRINRPISFKCLKLQKHEKLTFLRTIPLF